MANIAEHLKPNEAVINIGVTQEGIGAGYEVFQNAGFNTLGIARAEGATAAEGCEMPILINTESWGGIAEVGEGSTELSPVSQAITSVTNGEVYVLCGGGIGADEALTMALQGRTVKVFQLADGRGGASPAYAALRDLAEGKENSTVTRAINTWGGSRPSPENLHILFCCGVDVVNCSRVP
jgi:hypothetical protein